MWALLGVYSSAHSRGLARGKPAPRPARPCLNVTMATSSRSVEPRPFTPKAVALLLLFGVGIPALFVLALSLWSRAVWGAS